MVSGWQIETSITEVQIFSKQVAAAKEAETRIRVAGQDLQTLTQATDPLSPNLMEKYQQ